VEKAISVLYYKYVFVALGIQHAMRMCHFVSVVSRAQQYFPTLSHKRHHFRQKVFAHKMCFLIVSTAFVYNIYVYNSKKN
jgi:hypothetical protein